MAIAKVSKQQITIDLTLSEAEAVILLDILRHVGGDPFKGRRKMSDGIKQVLYEVGICPSEDDMISDGISFGDE